MLGHKVKIIYASASGNVEAVADKISEVLQTHGYEGVLSRAETIDITEIITHPLFIFATSTWEHGRLNPFFEPLLKEMQEVDLQGKYAGLVGLGDTRYEPVYFNEGINLVQKGFTKQGGIQIGDTLKIDGSPYSKLDDIVTNWTHMFVSNLTELGK